MEKPRPREGTDLLMVTQIAMADVRQEPQALIPTPKRGPHPNPLTALWEYATLMWQKRLSRCDYMMDTKRGVILDGSNIIKKIFRKERGRRENQRSENRAEAKMMSRTLAASRSWKRQKTRFSFRASRGNAAWLTP